MKLIVLPLHSRTPTSTCDCCATAVDAWAASAAASATPIEQRMLNPSSKVADMYKSRHTPQRRKPHVNHIAVDDARKIRANRALVRVRLWRIQVVADRPV
jgi:hypothetical protein